MIRFVCTVKSCRKKNNSTGLKVFFGSLEPYSIVPKYLNVYIFLLNTWPTSHSGGLCVSVIFNKPTRRNNLWLTPCWWVTFELFSSKNWSNYFTCCLYDEVWTKQFKCHWTQPQPSIHSLTVTWLSCISWLVSSTQGSQWFTSLENSSESQPNQSD